LTSVHVCLSHAIAIAITHTTLHRVTYCARCIQQRGRKRAEIALKRQRERHPFVKVEQIAL
jgi:hypothetical protein